MRSEVLHILGTAEPEGTGIARIVGALAAGLDPSRYHVHAWFLGTPGPLMEELRDAGAAVRCVPWPRGARDPRGAYRFWRGLRRHPFAIVHQHFGARSIRHLVRLASNAPIVAHLHGLPVAAPGSRSALNAMRGADRFVAVSRAVAAQYSSFDATVILHGVDVSPDAPPTRTCPELVIGAACRLVPVKGMHDLIAAVAPLMREFPNLVVEIAGVGPLLGDLQRDVACRGLVGRVRFLGWCRDMRPVLRRWDILVSASVDREGLSERAEGLGLIVLEAMAEGLPIVATAVGGVPELIEDRRTGYLVRASDLQGLTHGLRTLLGDPGRRRRMGTAGRERVAAHFSTARMVAEIQAIYDVLLAARH